ncbi:MAG: OstA-like protein [Bacteroidota bacterium]
MQKIHLFFILFILPFCLQAQQKTKIILENSETGGLNGSSKISYLRKPVFRHMGALMSCDSAVLYEDKNAFEAYNNVHIVQGDTINIYSDHLYYDGNTRIAHLTNNVRMVDKESVLTTNILDYNMATKVGTYVEGGKLVTKDVTLTSKNGYYFSNSRDAYFRYNVLVVSKQSTITSDTLRYNTLTNWAYFYGPTKIKSKDDNLYTENGAYNTKTEYAYFGKKNLYTNAAKSLKGDSLYYDGKAGYGKAVRNIIFKDTTDKLVLYGQLGYYYKKDERAVVTRNAYVGMGTKDSVTINKKLVPDSIWMGADTLETQMVLQRTLKLIESPVLKKDNELGEEEKPVVKAKVAGSGSAAAKKGAFPIPAVVAPAKKLTNKEKKALEKNALLPDSLKLKLPKADSLLKDSLALKKILPADSLAALKKLTDTLAGKKDSTLLRGLPVKADSLLKKAGPGLVKAATDTTLLKKLALKDSLPFSPADTIKTRAIKAYHNVRVFKANMQAVSDSLFYTSADSTLRWYKKPMLWSQGSQQTGDTIYLRLRNNKLNTLQVIDNGFIINVNADSAKYNQVKGKLITAFFKDGQLSTMFVDGNAESIYYVRDKDSVYTDLSQTVSARIKILFKNKEIQDLLTIKDAEGVKIPMAEIKEDKMLTGFNWKPELRPLSKQEIIKGKAKPKAAASTSAKGKTTVKKISVKDGKVLEAVSDQFLKQLKARAQKDSAQIDSIPLKKAAADSLVRKLKPAAGKADSLLRKLQPAPLKKK